MEITSKKAWAFGFLLILLFVLLSELTIVFNDYVFHRMGIDRNLTLAALWLVPMLAAYLASYYSRSFKLLVGLTYALILPIFGALAHYIHGELGGVVDFRGFSGAVVVFKIYFAVGSIIVLIGTGLGMLLSKSGEQNRHSI